MEITYEHSNRLYSALVYPAADTAWGGNVWTYYHRAMNAWVCGMSGLVGSLMLLMVTLRAAGSVTGERARHTLDELLTSPLSNREIVVGKWLGAILGVRRGWLWLGTVYFIGLGTGSLNIGSVLLTVAAWFAFAAFFSALGMWFTIYTRNTFVATAQAGVSALFVLGLHWAVTGIFCFFTMGMLGVRDTRELAGWLSALQLGLTPPYALGLFPYFSVIDSDHTWLLQDDGIKFMVAPILGVVVFALAALALRRAAVAQFGRNFCRQDIRYPDAQPPKVSDGSELELVTGPDATNTV